MIEHIKSPPIIGRMGSILLMLLCLSTSAFTQIALSGSETQVNTTTSNSQQNPAIASDSAGNHVVVWESYLQDTDDYGIYAQLYSNGVASGVEFGINNNTDKGQRFPDVAMLENGQFAVVWMSDNTDGDGYGIYLRVFDNTGAPLANQTRVNSISAGSQMHPKVATSRAGDFIVTWEDDTNEGSSSGIFARAYNSSGSALGAAFQVNLTTTGFQGHPDISADQNGNFVIVYQSESGDGDGGTIYASLYDNTFTNTVAEFQVNTTTAGNQFAPAVAMGPSGEFAVAWTSAGQDGSQDGIVMRLFDASGNATTSEQIVNQTTSGFQNYPAIAATIDGFYLVAWDSYGQDGSFDGVYARGFNASGTFIGNEAKINTRTTDFQQHPDIAYYSNAQAAQIAWQDGLRNSSSTHDGDDYGIYSQGIILADTTPPTAVCQNITAYLDGSGNVTITASDVDGGSTDNVAVTSLSINNSTFTCSNIGVNVVILTVGDLAGNTDNCAAAVTVIDTTSPNAVCQDITVYLDGTGAATILAGDIDNGSTDNCTIASYAASQTSFSCTNLGANSVTLTVTDGSGNAGTCTSTVTVLDTISPVASCSNLTVFLDGTGNATIVGTDLDGGSTDNCTITAYTSSQTSFTCSNIGSNAVSLTVDDASGNTASCAATVTVVDTTSPVAICQNITAYLDGSGAATIVATDLDGGSLDNCGISSYSASQTAFTCSNTGSNLITLTVTDDAGNTNSCVSNVTITDSTSPTAICQSANLVLDGTGNASLTANDINASSTDNCGIASLSISQSAFDCNDIGTVTVVLTVTDSSSNTSTCSASVIVSDTTAPTAACSNISVFLDGTGSATISGTDLDGGSTDNCAISSYTASQVSFLCGDIGTNTVTLTVDDASGNAATCTSTVTVIDSTAPTAICANGSVILDGTGNASILASAIDGGSIDNCGIASTSLDISTFGCGDIGSVTVMLTVTDNSGNSDMCSATVTVTDTTPPTAACQGLALVLDGSGNATITANNLDAGSTDNCAIVSYSASQTTFDCNDIGTNTVTLTVSDTSGNTATCTSAITVSDTTPPTAVCQAVSIFLDGTGNASITANDIDGGSTDNCTTVSLSATPTSFTCLGLGANTATLTVTDGSGNASTCVSTVTVVDSTPPTASCMAATVFLNGSGNGTISSLDIDAGSTDNCGVASATPDITTVDCNDVGTLTVNLTVSDASGNSATCASVVTVRDSTPPTASCQNATVFLGGTGTATLAASVIDGGSSDNCAIVSSSASDTSFTCLDLGNNTVILTVQDAEGNSATCVSTVTVADSTPPTAVCQNRDVYLDGTGNATLAPGDIDAGSSDNCSVASTGLSITAFDCNDLGTNTVTLTVIDTEGNTSTCTGVVTVLDTITPTASCQNVILFLDGSGNGTLTGTALDNGSADNCTLTSFTSSVTTFDCNDIGTVTATLTVADASGNSATCTSTVTVQDSTPPTAACNNPTLILDGSGNASIVAGSLNAGSSDNCGIASIAANTTTFDCNDIGANSVTLTVTDSSGNAATCTATVTVSDTIAPVAMCQDTTLYLDGTGTATVAAINLVNGSTDNCAIATYTASSTIFGCGDIGTTTVSLTITDTQGNSSICSSNITILDTIAPTAVCVGTTVYLGAAGTATLDANTIGGSSTDNCSVDSLMLDSTSFTCMHVGIPQMVTLTVWDSTGNMSTCTAMVSVEDTLPPVANCKPATVYLTTTGDVTISPLIVDDGSSDNCGIATYTVTPDYFNGPDLGANTVTLVVTDIHGNIDSCDAVVTVLDTLGTATDPGVSPTRDLTFQAFPNPTDGEVKVQITCSDCYSNSLVELRLTNIHGQVLRRIPVTVQAGSAEAQIDLSKYANGNYILSLHKGTQMLTKKIVKY